MSVRKDASDAPVESALASRCPACDAPPGVGCVTAPHSLGTRYPLRKPHRARQRGASGSAAAVARSKVLSARVLMTIDGPDGTVSTETELPSDAIALLDGLTDANAVTTEEAADVAQQLAELRLVLLRADRTLLEPIDAAAGLLRRLPGVAAELERRRLGSRR